MTNRKLLKFNTRLFLSLGYYFEQLWLIIQIYLQPQQFISWTQSNRSFHYQTLNKTQNFKSHNHWSTFHKDQTTNQLRHPNTIFHEKTPTHGMRAPLRTSLFAHRLFIMCRFFESAIWAVGQLANACPTSASEGSPVWLTTSHYCPCTNWWCNPILWNQTVPSRWPGWPLRDGFWYLSLFRFGKFMWLHVIFDMY